MTDSSQQDRKIIPVVEDKIIPVVEEEAVVVKRKKLTEGVRVRTVVREAEEIVDEPLATEEVEVERVALGHWIDAPVPVRQEGETTIVTLVEEVVVVEKRLRAIEEIRISKRKSIRRAPRTVTLRREEAVMERLSADGGKDDEPR